jgi:hypothetical protein
MVPSKNMEPGVIEWGKEEATTADTAVPRGADPEAARTAKARAALMGDDATTEDDADEQEQTGQKSTQEVAAEGGQKSGQEPAAKPARRDLFAKLEDERRKRGIEEELKSEQSKRRDLEKTVKEGSVLQLLQARGMTREQALEEMLTEPDGSVPVPKPQADPEVAGLKDKVSRLEAERASETMTRALEVVAKETADLDIPLVRAAKKIPVPTDNGGIRLVSGAKLVMETAHALWLQAGQQGGAAEYLKEAAQLVEEQLEEDNADLAAAYAAKKAPRVAKVEDKGDAPAKEKTAAVGKRMSAGSARETAASKLPMDADERRREVARRMGFT